MNLIEVMKQALEALELVIYPQQRQKNAITNLRAAIEEAEKQEPVAWMSPGKERLEFSRLDTVYGSHTIPLYSHPAQIPEGWQPNARAWLESLIASDELDNHILRDLIAMLEASPKP